MEKSFDRVIRAAVHDVAVPQGLADRILGSLAQQRDAIEMPASDSIAATSTASSPVEPIVVLRSPAPSTPWFKRRRTWLVTMAGLATAASLLIGLGLWLGRTAQQLSSEDVMDRARDFYNSDSEKPANGVSKGQLLSPKSPPRGFPLSADVVSNAKSSWRYTKAPFLGRNCVAYDLFSPKGTQATLYVIQLDGIVKGPAIVSPYSSPTTVPATSSGLATSTWNVDNRLLYVLVVKGNDRDYLQFLRPSGSLAHAATNACTPHKLL